MKKDFRVVSLPDTRNKDHACHCNRCDKSFHASEMVFGRFENSAERYRSDWYCPTMDCHGRLFGGVYFLTVSS